MRLAAALALVALSAVGTAACTPSSGTAARPSGTQAPVRASSDGRLTLGTLLPRTGSLASLGAPERDGVALAVQDVDAAGGVLGKPVRVVDADSGDVSTDRAVTGVERLLASSADVVVGASSSAVSKTVIDRIVGAGVVQISPANTSPDFTTYPDRGLYFRTAPSDLLQGRVLGDLVVEHGGSRVAVLAVRDAYGTGLTDSVAAAVTAGHGTVVQRVVYDPEAPDHAAEVARVKAAAPDAVVLIGFSEVAGIVEDLVAAGIGPQQGVALYLSDGAVGQASLRTLPPGTLPGVVATVPGAGPPPAFRTRLLALDPSLHALSYAAEAYDAVVLVALAAEEAHSDAGVDIAAHLQDVSRGGQRCTDYATCAALVRGGADVDYDGLSGPVDLDDAGDVVTASIGVFTYGADGSVPLVAQEHRTGRP